MSSRRKQISAAAALSLTGAAVLTVAFWKPLEHLIFGLLALRLAWAVIRARLGIRPRPARHGKSLWEVSAALIGGYLLGHRHGTHPCGQCGAPIGKPSRAVYCSPTCRHYAALTRARTAERAERLAAFGDVPEGFGA